MFLEGLEKVERLALMANFKLFFNGLCSATYRSIKLSGFYHYLWKLTKIIFLSFGLKLTNGGGGDQLRKIMFLPLTYFRLATALGISENY